MGGCKTIIVQNTCVILEISLLAMKASADNAALHGICLPTAVSLNVEHELTRQRKWDKQETQEYMRHFNALKLNNLTSVPPLALIAATGNARGKKESSNVRLGSKLRN